MTENWQRGGFGLYVHWPFCEAKCPYCDFNSHVTRSIDQKRWSGALAAEVRRYGAQTPDRVLSSIFFGGGTPSLMEPATVEAVIAAARSCWTFANDIEITLEANPRSVETARFDGYARAGVNRVSLGIQALRASDLKKLGRLHDVDEAKTALQVAQSIFDRVSFDLIYARQGQTLDDWQTELGEALATGIDHLSLYQLTLEPGTAFWDRAQAGGLRDLPDEDLAADMYALTQTLCAAAGLPAYEVSNHARPGSESRHNLIYWRSGDWVGVGPGAHGRISQGPLRQATVAELAPGAWLAKVAEGSGDVELSTILQQDAAVEHIMMGLRTLSGVELEYVRGLSSTVAKSDDVSRLEELGLVRFENGFLCATERGRMMLNSVVSELLP